MRNQMFREHITNHQERQDLKDKPTISRNRKRGGRYPAWRQSAVFERDSGNTCPIDL